MKKNEYHLPVTSSQLTAVDVLAEATELSRQKIKQTMQKGCVWLETGQEQADKQRNQHIQRLRRAKKVLSEGDTVHFYYDEKVLETEPPEATLVYDQGNYSIWNKPSGMLSQGSKWGDHCTIYRWAEKHLSPERAAFLVHRLDRAANGLIIIAHKKQIAVQFSKMFQQREIEKYYHAIVKGDLSSKFSKNEKTITIAAELDAKKAVSHVTFLEYDAKTDESLLEVQIETGRKHQIRKHLSIIGFAVVGDRLYGEAGDVNGKQKDLQLSAVALKFCCPVSGKDRRFKLSL